MSSSSSAGSTPWGKVVAVALGAGLVITLLLLAFTWPSKTAEPRNLPIAVAGPAQAAAGVAAQLGESGTFEVTTVADRDAAVALVREREALGAVVIAPAPEVLTATAAGAAPAQVLRGVAEQLEAQLASQGDPADVAVTDIVPLSSDDASGAGLGAAAFPLAVGGVLGGVLVSLLVVGAWRRVAGVVAYGAVGGLSVTLVLHAWFGYVAGHFALAWLAVGLTLSATAFLITGMNALLGRPGLGLAAAFTVLVANPLSGATLPWQFIAEPWGAFGQYLVPGASGSLVRSISYFPDASTTTEWWTLLAWAAAGLVLLFVGILSARRTVAEEGIADGEARAEVPASA